MTSTHATTVTEFRDELVMQLQRRLTLAINDSEYAITSNERNSASARARELRALVTEYKDLVIVPPRRGRPRTRS